MLAPRLFRPRLVLPTELAGPLAQEAGAFRSPGRTLTFVPLVVNEAQLRCVLRTMALVSAEWLRRHPGAPRILDVARYEREPDGENDYLALPLSLGEYAAEYQATTGHRVFVDCDDLEIGASAEAIAAGDMSAQPEPVRVGESMWHVRTRLGDGRIQDSTRIQLRKQGQREWNP